MTTIIDVYDLIEQINIETDMTTLVTLPEVWLRSNESKTLDFKLRINDTVQDLTGWTIELYLDNVLTRSITTVTAAATVGQIKDQTTNKGEFFFTLLAADLAALAVCPETNIGAYIRFVTGSTPPNDFSNVSFNILLKKA